MAGWFERVLKDGVAQVVLVHHGLISVKRVVLASHDYDLDERQLRREIAKKLHYVVII